MPDNANSSAGLRAGDIESLALALAGDSTGNGVFRVIAAIAADRLGCLVFTASKARPGSMEVERVFSSNAETYPIGVLTNKRETQWGRHVLMQGKVFVGEGALAMAAAFDDKEGMGRAGVQSIINIPILLREQSVGVLNFGFSADRIDAAALTAARCLGLAATGAYALAAAGGAQPRVAIQEPTVGASLPLLRSIGSALDGLGVGMCAFDEQDQVLLWNREFLRLFPEHAADIHVGEPYRANLRRFYEGRLSAEELPSIDRYIEEGIARHREQQRPFDFEHRGARIRVASLPLPGAGRIRIWRQETEGTIAKVGETTLSFPGWASPDNDANLLRYLAEGLALTDAGDRIVWTNGTFLSLYDFDKVETVIGVGFEEAYRAAWRPYVDDEGERYESGMAVLHENLRFVGAPFEVPLPGRRWVRVTQQRRPDGSGCSTHVDISELRRRQDELRAAEQQARTSRALLETTLERMQQGVIMVNADRIVEVCNKRAMELLDLPKSLMESKPRFDEVLAYQWSTDEFRLSSQTLQEFVRAGGILDRPQIYDRKRPNGRIIEVQSVPIAEGGVLRTYTDITERKRNEERIQHLARHDGLTALVNRGAFLEHLSEAMQRASSHEECFAVHYVDLDRFKPINDEHGHAIGDEVLAIVSKRMQRIARETDVVARMGGDEFAILQRRTPDVRTALGLAQRVLADIGEPLHIESLRLHVGASIGIALFPGHAEAVDTLVRHADLAMYAAKSAGGNCVRVYADGSNEPAGGGAQAAAHRSEQG